MDPQVSGAFEGGRVYPPQLLSMTFQKTASFGLSSFADRLLYFLLVISSGCGELPIFPPFCRAVHEFLGNKLWYSLLIAIPRVFKAWSKDQVPHRLHAKYGAEEKAAGRVPGLSQWRTCQVTCSRYNTGSCGHLFFYQLYLREFSIGWSITCTVHNILLSA